MATEYEVKKAARKMKRDITKVFGSNFLKIITEIILNSDDSYKRLEKYEDEKSVKDIIVSIKRDGRKVEIIDYAEGMHAEDFQRIFTEYGAQHNLDENGNVRGLFGQGASDVLFYGAYAAKHGEIRSIKDKQLHVCKFVVADKQKVKIETVTRSSQIKNFIRKYNITDTATIVSFGLGEKVNIPHKNFIKQKIESFYMLRYVLSDPYRRVILKCDGNIDILSSKTLVNQNEEMKLNAIDISFKYNQHTLKGKMEIYEDSNTDKDEKIIIIDEHERVYDNTLFGLEETSGATRIKGVLVISGLYEMLNQYLNQEQPEEILRDSRDGFDQRQNFTKKMFATCKKHIQQEIQNINQKYEPRQVSLDGDKVFKNALRRINAFYSELKLEEIGNLDKGSEPPGEGIRFVRPTIYITKGKTYDLKLLINSNMVDPKQVIRININQMNYLELKNKEVSYEDKDIDENGLVTKSVVIKGNQVTKTALVMDASTNGLTTRTNVNIVEEVIIYPEHGMQFIPSESKIKPNKTHTLKLYVDVSRFPLGTKIQVNRTTKAELIPDSFEITVQENYCVNEALAVIPIDFPGGKLHEIHHFEAICEDIKTKCIIRIVDSKENKQGLEGLFSGLDAEYDQAADWQSAFSVETGKISINLAHPINISMLKNMDEEALKNYSFTQDQYLYIFELVSYECAKQIVKIKLKKNEIADHYDITLPDIQTIKTRLFNSIYSEHSKE